MKEAKDEAPQYRGLSERGGSDSIQLANAFLADCQSQAPALEIDRLNVWDAGLPEFDAAGIGAKYKAIKHQELTGEEAHVWNAIEWLIQRFQAADRLLLSSPMWNFSIPYKLKHLIDLVAQRNYLFTYDGQHYGPLLSIPRALVLYTRGSRYREDSPLPPSQFDH